MAHFFISSLHSILSFFLSFFLSFDPQLHLNNNEERGSPTWHGKTILPSLLNPRPNTQLVNKLDSPPTTGLFARVSSKPTNHSKFTDKCGTPRCSNCHLHPACKSKDKTKDTQKLKSNNAVLNAELITHRGFSASKMLDHLNDEDEAMEDEDEVDYHVKDSYSFADFFHHYDHDACNISEMGLHVEGDEDWCCVDECGV